MPTPEKRKAKSFSARPSLIKTMEGMARSRGQTFSEFVVKLVEKELIYQRDLLADPFHPARKADSMGALKK